MAKPLSFIEHAEAPSARGVYTHSDQLKQSIRLFKGDMKVDLSEFRERACYRNLSPPDSDNLRRSCLLEGLNRDQDEGGVNLRIDQALDNIHLPSLSTL
jgi:hypothetical protein